METIKHCISIKEPYASMIVAKQKSIEWRSRKLIARPPETIAIATSKAGAGNFLPGGHIVGIARISAVVPWQNTKSFYERCAALDEWENGWANWTGYAYMIGGFAACKPVPVRGNTGVYRTPEGFEPEYAETPEQLREWWSGARIWSDGAQNDDERLLRKLMIENGIGWRIDD